MDRRLEVVEALMDLSRASQKIAKLVAEGALGDFKDETVLSTIGDSKEVIDIARFADWPPAFEQPRWDKPGPFEGLRVLEFNGGPQPPVSYKLNTAKSIDLITHGHAIENQPANVRIINSSKEQRTDYDVGIIWESLEFVPDPAKILMMFQKRCHKVYIRFRPWSSRNGAFMADVLDKAYAHLVMDMDHEVKFKAIRPLATYEALVKVTGMPVHERHINTSQPSTFFTTNEEIMRVIRERTWGKISFDQAIKIMATDSVDYVLGYSVEELLR